MLKDTLRHHMLPFGFTFTLMLLEALLTLLFPLFIGYALDGAMSKLYRGIWQLGALGFATLIIGMGRRLFDSRFYAKIYQEISSKTVLKLGEQATSLKAARLSMLKELVEFLEFSLPELINALISLMGVIIIIATLNFHVFYGTLITTMVILLIYWMSSTKTLRFNKASNDELEKKVEVIASNNGTELKSHLKQLMHWNIKLSDLEALNFSLSWFALMAFLIVSIVLSADGQGVNYGVLFSLVMYVFQYMENVINIPLFYQNWLRLKEITQRLFAN